MPPLDIPTLVDCGCRTVVYGDGSGVEIVYCGLHWAAADLLAIVQQMMAHHRAQLPSEVKDLYGGGCDCPLCRLAVTAIAKVNGQTEIDAVSAI